MILYEINAIFNLKKKNILLPIEIKKSIDIISNNLENRYNKRNKIDLFKNDKEAGMTTSFNKECIKFNLIEKKINIILNSLSKVNYSQVNKNLIEILDSCLDNRDKYEKYILNIVKDNSIKINMLSGYYIELLNNINSRSIIDQEVNENINFILSRDIFNKNNSNGFITYIGQLYNHNFLSTDQLQSIIDSLVLGIEDKVYFEKSIIYLYELLKTIKDDQVITSFKTKYKPSIDKIYQNNDFINMKLKFKLLDITELSGN